MLLEIFYSVGNVVFCTIPVKLWKRTKKKKNNASRERNGAIEAGFESVVTNSWWSWLFLLTTLAEKAAPPGEDDLEKVLADVNDGRVRQNDREKECNISFVL